MQFDIPLETPPRDLRRIEEALASADPSVLVDLVPGSGVLRVSSVLDERTLALLVTAAGAPVVQSQVERLPSNCCGGCGG